MFFMKFVKFYRISFSQKTAGRLLPISSNISDILLALLAINQSRHNWLSVKDLNKELFASNSHCLPRKYLKEPRLKETFFVAEVDVTNKKGYSAEAVVKYLIKLTGKHLCRSLSLACRRETLLKKRLPLRCFPIKFIRATFSKDTYEQFDSFDDHI